MYTSKFYYTLLEKRSIGRLKEYSKPSGIGRNFPIADT